MAGLKKDSKGEGFMKVRIIPTNAKGFVSQECENNSDLKRELLNEAQFYSANVKGFMDIGSDNVQFNNKEELVSLIATIGISHKTDITTEERQLIEFNQRRDTAFVKLTPAEFAQWKNVNASRVIIECEEAKECFVYYNK